MKCHHSTLKGTRCKNNCFSGGDTCWLHAQDCSICLEKLSTRDEVATLKCKHQFHAGCILSWHDQGHSRCPLCRAFVLTPSKVTIISKIEVIENKNLMKFVRDQIFNGELPGDRLIVETDGDFFKIKDEYTGIYIKDRVPVS
jgi:hypothetical protein